jgi:hypothetical protein
MIRNIVPSPSVIREEQKKKTGMQQAIHHSEERW